MRVHEIYKITKGKKAIETSVKTNLRYIQIEDLRTNNEIKYTTVDKGNVTCNRNDVLIAWDGANAGTVGYNLEGVIGSTLAKLSPLIEGVSPDYSGRFLQSKFKYLRESCTGATIPHISRASLETLEIPLPPLTEQKKIAALLDAADSLRQKDKALIAKYDELTQSLFLEMFGDPVRNEKGWEKVKLESFGKIVTGNTPPRNNENNYNSRHIEWIKTDNITSENLFVTTATEYLSKEGLSQGRFVEKGSLLVACIAGSIKSIGRAALTNRSVSMNQQINAIQPNNDISSLFLYFLFKCSVEYIQEHASNGMKRMLSKGDFQKILMIKPPFNLQSNFAERVQAIEKQKSLAQLSLKKSEELFEGLLNKVFENNKY